MPTAEALPPSAPDHGLLAALIELRGDLVAFLARRLRCRATAEDIAQDVYLRLSAAPVAARHPSALIFCTAANLASNHVRDEARRAAIRREAIAPVAPTADECDPERAAIARDALHRLAVAISGWPARTREVFILNRYDGLTQREIAARLRLSSTSVERHMARAIRSLAELAARDGW